MSMEQARAFLEKVKNDEDLQKRLSDAQDKESRWEIAKQEGFEFTLGELGEASDELGEADLEGVGGGRRPPDECFTHRGTHAPFYF